MPLNFPRRRAGQGITADEFNTITRFIDGIDDRVNSTYVKLGNKGSNCDFTLMDDGNDHIVFQKAYNEAKNLKKSLLLMDCNVQLINGGVTISNNVNIGGFGDSTITVGGGRTITITNNSENCNFRFFNLTIDGLSQNLGPDRVIEVYSAKDVVFENVTLKARNFGFFILTVGVNTATSHLYFKNCIILGTGEQDNGGGGQLEIGYAQPSNITFDNCRIIQDVTGIKYYRSLQDNNVNHPLTDTNWWVETDVPKLTLFTPGVTYHKDYIVGTKYQGALSIVGGDNIKIINGSVVAGSCIAGFEKAPNTNYTFQDSTILPAKGGKIGETGIIALTGFGYDNYTNTGANFVIRRCKLIDTFVNCYNSTATKTQNIVIEDNEIISDVVYSSQIDNNFPGAVFIEGANIVKVNRNKIKGSLANKLQGAISIRLSSNVDYGDNDIENAIEGVKRVSSNVGMTETIPNRYVNVNTPITII